LDPDSFNVQDIRNQFCGSTHLIEIDLKGGHFNRYWYFKGHEGIEKGEIGFGIPSTLSGHVFN
jgi:hypothetical protein